MIYIYIIYIVFAHWSDCVDRMIKSLLRSYTSNRYA